MLAIYYCDGHLLLWWPFTPALECGWYTQWEATEENWCPIFQQLLIANIFLAGVGLCAHFPFFMLKCLSVWHFSCPVHALTVSVSSYAHLPCCVWKCYLKITHTSGFYNILVCPHTPDLWREECDKDTPSRDEHSKMFHSPYVVQLWVLYISSFAPKVVNGTSDLNIVIQINLHASLWNSLSRIPWKTIKWRKWFPSRISSVLTFTRIHDYEEPLKQYFYN